MSHHQYLFDVPLPLRGLSPNGGASTQRWGVAKARRDYREQCRLSLLGELFARPPEPIEHSRVHLVAMVCRKRAQPGDTAYRPVDTANLVYAAKPLFDALKDAGVIVDDSQEHMELGRVTIVPVMHFHGEGVLVRVERALKGDA